MGVAGAREGEAARLDLRAGGNGERGAAGWLVGLEHLQPRARRGPRHPVFFIRTAKIGLVASRFLDFARI
jgi:hypothetical protein